MATVITSPIPNIQTPWENYSGDRVEDFIKDTFNAKYGWLYRTPEKLSDGYYHIYAFASQDSYQEWREYGDPSLIIQNISLPNPENASYAVEITTNSNTNKIVNLGNGVKIGIKFTSTATDPFTLVTTDTGNDGTLYIQKQVNNFWITQATVQIDSVPLASDTYTQIDITQYLSDGDNVIRVRVDDNVNGLSSANIVFKSIVNTTLALENVTPQTSTLTAMSFNYYIQGRISKTLNINITTNNQVLEYTFPIGEGIYTETYYTTPTISGVFNTGIIEVESWLSVDEYPELESIHVFNQFYYVEQGQEETNPVVIVNNLVDTATNYTPTNFFDFILFNQVSDVTITFYDSTRTNKYLEYTYPSCPTNTLITFGNQLQVESEAQTISSIIIISSNNLTLATETITVDNSVNYNPTAGADFVLNPQTRSNSEQFRNTIINYVNNQIISSTFTNFDFHNDGWCKDENNISVLRVPTGRTLTINYDALVGINNGMTFELDFKVKNVFDDDNVVFKFCEYSGSTLYGFEMKSLEAAFGTQQNTVRRDQDVMFCDETRTHLAINIIPNLSNSGLNYIRIFINGIINREILYNTTDVFKLSNNLPIVIGGEDVDIDIYSIRCYKKSLSAENIRQDYISSLPSIEAKNAFREENAILANSVISYDLASTKYNTMIWTGTVADYVNQGEGIGNGTLTINILGRPECSGTINNMTCKGQGSSSKGYWKWNQQYGFSDDSVWIDGNGETRGKFYMISPDAQPAKKLVAKINWASPQQSHKLGATAMYTDLWKEIIGGNSITNTEGYENCRISVEQKPFLFFTRTATNANPVFYGIMTFGPGKADKPTFGYYPSVFPYQLWIEGSDNGLPLISRQVPWIDEDVTYNAEEEYYEYANSGNIDVNMGDLTLYTKFRDAFNYTFLHSQYLRPFTGNIPADADTKYQYWNNSTMDVYRYDYINETWVNAGITKENGDYTVLNLESQTGLLRTNYASDDAYNAACIDWRTSDFRSGIGTYYNVNDCLFTIAFLKIIAASDNRCKNTYEYLDPTTRLICMWQDDMDTILATDNVGRKNKPYYVEEHDVAPNGNNYWNGADNVFYNLMETAFSTELRGMINSIFNSMRSKAGSVYQCMYNYFFSVQNYLPAVAYNETTRLLYEQASVAQKAGTYQNGTPAITQALGDQLQCELMWWKRREPYMESLGASAPFSPRSTGAIGFRANTMIDGGGNTSTNVSFGFELTPQQWLYPKVGAGQSLGGDITRVEALDQYYTNTINTSADTDVFIYGANYYVDYGEFVNIPVGEQFELSGDKLLNFSADSRNASVDVQFRPTAISVNCPNLRTLTLYGISSLTGSIDLSVCTKLQSVDLRGTNITSVILPESYDLTTAYMPSNIISLTANNVPNLNNLSIVDYSTIRIINTDNSELALDILEAADSLSSITLNGINIITTAVNADVVYDNIASPNTTCNITGSIYIDKQLTSTEKNALEAKFGSNIFVSTSPLYISFIYTNINSVSLSASKTTLGNNDICTVTASYTGTNDASYEWTVSGGSGLLLTRSKTMLTIETGTISAATTITVTYTITKVNDETISSSQNIVLMPYEFYINGEDWSEYDPGYIYYGNGDNSASITTNAVITCSEIDKTFIINSITSDGGSATFSGTTITSFNITNLGEEYNIFTVSLTIDLLTVSYDIYVYDEEVVLDINNIPAISAVNGTGSGSATFNYRSGFASMLSVVSAVVTGGNTNTVSNLTLNGCTINCSGYTASGTRTLTVTYKVNNGADCTVSRTFSVNYFEVGATMIAEYYSSSFTLNDSWYINLNIFTNDSNFSGWPKDNNNNYLEQESCSISFNGNTYNLTWGNLSSNGYCYYYVQNHAVKIILQPYGTNYVKLMLTSDFYDGTYDVTVNLTLIGNNLNNFAMAWYHYTSLKSIELQNLARLSGNVFENCTRLTSVTLPNTLTNINYNDFKGCTSLTSITIPNSVSVISGGAFYGCTSLTSVTIPASVSTIDVGAFGGCSKVSTIIINRTSAPTITSTTWGSASTTATGYNSGTTNILYVPTGATGYAGSGWEILLSASYGKFTVSATL